MTEPFNIIDHSSNLINISSGLVPDVKVQNYLLNVKEHGREMVKEFVSTRFNPTNEKSVDFFKPIKKSGLLTFNETRKSFTVRRDHGTKSKVRISPEHVYQRALALSKVRPDVDLSVVLSYPLTDVPSSLFKEDIVQDSL